MSSAFRTRFLRPGYHMQNDLNLRAALTGPGISSMPIGTAGICAVDTRDIAQVGELESAI